MLLTSVLVVCRIGEASYPRCGAERLANGDLIIRSLDTGEIQNVHIAGAWVSADDGGRFIGATVPPLPISPLSKRSAA